MSLAQLIGFRLVERPARIGVPVLPTDSVLMILEAAGRQTIVVIEIGAVTVAILSGGVATVNITTGDYLGRRYESAGLHGLAERG